MKSESKDIDTGHNDLPLDGATAHQPAISLEMASATEIAKDISMPLEERLEAFDDVIDSEVGDTTFTRARNIEREVGLRQVYLKFEGGNPTGTQKDRIAFAQAADALRRGFDAVTVATCGNYGVAMSLAASLVGLKSFIYVPEGYHSRRLQEMLQQGAQIRREGTNYEHSVIASQQLAEAEEIYDANPGGPNTPIQLQAYSQIAFEIYDELRDAPQAVALPVSNGTTLAGVYKGFMSLYRRGKTSRIPRMVAGSSTGKNPILHAWQRNLETCEDLDPTSIRGTQVNEPLVNWHSIDGEAALEAIRSTDGWATNASDRKMAAFSKLIREREGFSILPASTAGLIALAERHSKVPLPNDRYVVVLTGKK
jgi:threonine synthase